jgi:hypothetical protein
VRVGVIVDTANEVEVNSRKTVLGPISEKLNTDFPVVF